MRGKQAPLSADEIVKMRKVGRIAARTLEHVAKYIKPGITTNEIDQIVFDFGKSFGAVPGPLGYNGYPKSCCTSINDVVCHGLPGDEKLKEGDIINVDVTPVLDGFYGDTSATFAVGKVSDKALDIIEVARLARDKGIEAIIPGAKTGDIGFATDRIVTRRGYTAVKEIGGHGVGRIFHDDPFVPAFGKKGRGDILRPGYCITVEPMVNEGSPEFDSFDIPNSSIQYYKTVDGGLSAQFEHTVLITPTGYEIMTLAD